MSDLLEDEIGKLFNRKKVERICKKEGCYCPDDVLTQIANTPAFIRAYFETIGEIKALIKVESKNIVAINRVIRFDEIKRDVIGTDETGE